MHCYRNLRSLSLASVQQEQCHAISDSFMLLRKAVASLYRLTIPPLQEKSSAENGDNRSCHFQSLLSSPTVDKVFNLADG